MEPIINKNRLNAEAKHWRELELGYRRKPPADFLSRFINPDFYEYAPKFFRFLQRPILLYMKRATALQTPGEDAAFYFVRLLLIGITLTALVTAFGRFGQIPYAYQICAFGGVAFAIRSLLISRGDWIKAASIACSGFLLPTLVEYAHFLIVFRPFAVAASLAYMGLLALQIDYVCVHAYHWIASNPRP